VEIGQKISNAQWLDGSSPPTFRLLLALSAIVAPADDAWTTTIIRVVERCATTLDEGDDPSREDL
jgi:hypothetical protein